LYLYLGIGLKRISALITLTVMDSSPPAAVSQSPNPPADNFEDVMALFEGDNQGQEYPDNELYLLAEEVASSYSPQPSETSSKEGVYICVVYVFVCECGLIVCVCVSVCVCVMGEEII